MSLTIEIPELLSFDVSPSYEHDSTFTDKFYLVSPEDWNQKNDGFMGYQLIVEDYPIYKPYVGGKEDYDRPEIQEIKTKIKWLGVHVVCDVEVYCHRATRKELREVVGQDKLIKHLTRMSAIATLITSGSDIKKGTE